MQLHRNNPLEDRLTRVDRTLRARRDHLAAEAAAGNEIPAAGAWLLDNFSYLHTLRREICEAVPRGYYRYLARLSHGEARVYSLAVEFVARTRAEFELEAARAFWDAQQQAAVFTLAELWAIGPMLKAALLETVAEAAEDEILTGNAITTLRLLDSANWRDFVEALSAVERILRHDPAGVYARMEFETRDGYRHRVESTARAARIAETEVAALALELARRDGVHIGEFLTGERVSELHRRTGFRRPLAAAVRDAIYRFPNFFYLGMLALVTAALVFGMWRLLAAPWWAAALIALPASQAALALVNPLVNRFIPPRRLPRMDFSEGIPPDCRTFVVVPTLLLSRTGVERLLENLEIHYLANRDPNLLFALLTDFPDARTRQGPHDGLLEYCAEGIRRLNERHGSAHAPFYLFHRARQWNASEDAWMGWERKRGKLTDFNRYLLGEADAFDRIEGDTEAIGGIRYVITLDSDTQLPRETAGKLVAAMAHPLNRPVFEERTGLVRRGYALMQPRVSISMDSAGQSQLARIFSGQTGFDPYTTAVSDIYQDVYGRASFTGKGIYDLRAFHRATEGRFPENTLLSHDLIEGEHVRTALVTDLEFIDDYPSSYEAYSKRKHRWVRGDWQIAMWALPWAPDARWRWRRNRLPLVSRWKIFDNLRRSLVEISLVAMLAAGWFGLGAGWPLAALAMLAFPAWAELAMAILRVPPPRFWGAWVRETGWRFAQAHFEALFHLVFLAHQAAAMADAVVRTLVRRAITHRRLLEWESAAQAEASAGRRRSLMLLYLYGSPLVALAGALAVRTFDTAGVVTLAVLELWIFAPLIVRWVDSALPAQRGLPAANRAFLRDLALQTWRYFADYCRAEDNWLVPDNVQEDPPAEARTISPTNLGLLLDANQAAHDFGYLTPQEAVERTERTLRTMQRLPRWRGHFYNWYDTRTLLPVLPHYISSVDSGNLAASLVALKQGCLECLRGPLVGPSALEGLRDHAARLVNALAEEERSGGIVRLLAALGRQLDYRPTDLFYWEGVLSEAAKMARRLCEHAERAAARMERRNAADAAEVRYWAAALAARWEAVARDLYALAPWLDEPFEMELRMRAADPTLLELLAVLYRVPAIGELPAHYDLIEEKVRDRLAEEADGGGSKGRAGGPAGGPAGDAPQGHAAHPPDRGAGGYGVRFRAGDGLRLPVRYPAQAAAGGLRRGRGPSRRGLLRPACIRGPQRGVPGHRQGRPAARGVVPPGPQAHGVARPSRAALLERHHVRVPHAVAVHGNLRQHGAGPQPAVGGGDTANLRQRAQRAVGHFRIGIRRPRQRHALPVLRLRSTGHRAETPRA